MKAKYEKPAIESKEVFERISAVICNLPSRNSGRTTCAKQPEFLYCGGGNYS